MTVTDALELAKTFDPRHLSPQFYDDPYSVYAALRAHDPVHAIEGGFFLTRYDDCLAVYRDRRFSSDKKQEFAPKFGDSPLFDHHTTSLVFNDPPLHTRVRKIIMGALTPRHLKRLEHDLDILVDELVADVRGRGQFDLIEDFAVHIPVEIIGNLLEVPKAERGPLRAWSTAILSALEPTITAEQFATGNRAVTEFVDYLKVLVAERRKNIGDPDTDVLSRLILGEHDGEQLSESELLQNCIFLLNAGHETTTNLIGNGIWLLLSHGDERRKLATNPALINSAVEEFLRFESPVQLNNRRTTETVDLGDVTLAPGTSVTLCIAAANRDATAFPDPDRLDIARKPNFQIAFGHSIHACAGMNLARLEGRIAIGKLMAALPDLTLDGTPERDRRARFRGFKKIPAKT
ncbi:cytochrome P450 [Govanella unica]|uniref:Cytochrome P450 n=1 Tax=Govanella unica TaxID=2975056 RepID=A0A9X3TWE8_9PROT|nr:cytochrome P450 [Govania unica]MDA5192878.1 cytochrome P450 [Govania unica]